MPCALRQFVEKLRLTAPLIAYNGALIADPQTENTLASFPIEAALGREIAEACEELNLHIQAYEGDAFWCETANQFAKDYQAFLNCPVRLEAVGEKLSGWLAFDTPKMLAIDTAERVQAVLPALRARFAGRVKVATSNPKFIEFVSPKAGKAVALARLSELLAIPKEEIVAFGERARAAEASGGLDFKALSHSVRVVSEMQEILTTGRIVFPLPALRSCGAFARAGCPSLPSTP